MQTIIQKIYANASATSQPGYSARIAGRTCYVQGCDAGTVLTVTLTDLMGNRDTVVNVGAGAKLTPAAGFQQIDITTSADANVQLVVTNGDIDVQLNQLGTNVTNTSQNPVPVTLVSEPGAPVQVSAPVGQEVNVKVSGTVNVSGATMTATNVGINNTAASPVPVTQAINATVATVAPVVVAANATGTAVLAADATRRGLRMMNPAGAAGPVALVPDNVTNYADAAIVLQPGDAWNETDAPAAAWYASTPAGAAWAANTAYALNAKVNANGNAYRCTTAGTSAASGSGPSGTGTAIADNTAVWAYVGALAAAQINLQTVKA